MKDWVRKQSGSPQESIREILRKTAQGNLGVAVIVDENDKLVGYVADSDIRRAMLRDVNLDATVSEIMVQNPVTLPAGLSSKEYLEMLRANRVSRAPVVDADGRVKDIAIYWLLQEELEQIGREPAHLSPPAPRVSSGAPRILVIGAAGYVGSVLCRELLHEGYIVRGLDRFMFGDESIQEIVGHPNFEMVKGDIRNLDVLVDSAFGVDAVINLAAIVGDPACDLDVNHTIMINYFCARAAADAARHCRVDRYLFFSTAAVYGASSGQDRLTEASAVAPVSLYAETKLKSEAGILSLKDANFSPVIFRLGTAYGLSPRMRFDLVVNLFVLHAMTKRKLTVRGGQQWRPYVHVQDIARATVLALRAEKSKIHGEIFNLGSNDLNLRVIDLAKKVASLIPGTEVIYEPDATDQRDYNVSFEKLERALGFQAEWNIERAVLEIKERFERGVFEDVSDKKYSNVRLQEHLVFG